MADMKPNNAGPVSGPTGRRRGKGARGSRLKLAIFGVIVMVFGYLYLGGSYGWDNMWKLRQQKARLQAEVWELETRKRELTGELELLEGDAEVDEQTRFKLERLAREEHGMAREDELIYRFPAEETDTTEVRPPDFAP